MSLSAALIDQDAESAKPGRSFLCDRDFLTAALGLVNAMLGAAVLAYPYAFMNAGAAVSAVICLCVIAPLSAAAATVLFRSMHIASGLDSSVRSYGDLVRVAFGPRLAGAVDALIVVYSFGTCIGYLILLADVLTPFVVAADPAWGGASSHESGPPASWRIVLSLVSVLCALMCMLRTISALRHAAVMGVLATFFIVAMLVSQAASAPCRQGDCADECGLNGWCTAEQLNQSRASGDATCNGERGFSLWPQGATEVLRALPLFAFALQCHIQSAIVFTELPARLRHDGATRAIATLSTGLMIGLDVAVGLAGFARFGAQTQGDVLKNFGLRDGLADGARACLACAALCSFPLQHFPARLALHGFVSRRRRSAPVGEPPAGPAAELPAARPAPSLTFVVTEAIVWVAVTLGLAQLVGSALANVFQLVGAVCGSSVIFTLPGAIWLKLGPRGSASRAVVGGLLVSAGLFILATGTAVTIEQIVAGASPERECRS